MSSLSFHQSNFTSGSNNTYWLDSTPPLIYTKLLKNISTEVVVIGGGIAGLTSAYLLTREGRKVVLVEDGNIGSGETGRTTAHIVSALDDRYYNLEKLFGTDGAKLAAESHSSAIELIEHIVVSEGIDCDFERLDGYLFIHPSDNEKSIEDEHKSTLKAGINTRIINGVPGIPSEKGKCLKFPDQAQFHPMKYLKGLCDAIIKHGGEIYTGTHANEINKNGIISTEGFSIKANYVVIATNTPVNNLFVMHTKQAAYRTYVIAAKVKKGVLPKALWWDTGDQNSEWHVKPYHYVRLQDFNETHDLLICGGEDHKTGQADDKVIDRFKNLKEWTKKRFPMIEDIIYRWSGQVMEPVDSLAFIGPNPNDNPNIFIATGDSGNGITGGTIAGIIISDKISGKENKWLQIYDPSRISIKSSPEFFEENVNVVKQMKDYFTAGDIKEIENLIPGEGAIFRKNMTKIAIYNDDEGTLHAYSAICTHLGCIVHWNKEEKTFDCPCHGSRFTCYGEVINGPANSGLEPYEIPQGMISKNIYAEIKKDKGQE
jgi:glycine/D-amino acid oxidase-like deaminating enzyme/nitrite reductase/ring-hydroxylating ferredoxin subunit